MQETTDYFPYRNNKGEKILAKKALFALSFEQIMEIANVFFFMNKTIANRPQWRGGVPLSEEKRILHKSIHDSAVNCLLSLEEAERLEEKDGIQ